MTVFMTLPIKNSFFQESDYHSHVERCRSMSQALSGLGHSTKPQREPRKKKAEFHLPPIHPIATDKQLVCSL